MKCYFHKEKVAVGVCAQCHRGVCEEKGCGRFESNSLFCRDHNYITMKGELMKMTTKK